MTSGMHSRVSFSEEPEAADHRDAQQEAEPGGGRQVRPAQGGQHALRQVEQQHGDQGAGVRIHFKEFK